MNHLDFNYPIFLTGTQPDTCETGCSKVKAIEVDSYCPYMNWIYIHVKGYRMLVDADRLSNLRNFR